MYIVKSNWQVFPIADRGIDMLGYKMYPTHTLIRKSIKKNFARKLARVCSVETVASYKGWLVHANTINITKQLLGNEI